MAIAIDLASINPPGEAAIANGLSKMAAADTPVIVTTRFVSKVRELTGDESYHDDRGGGDVAARTVTSTAGEVIIVVNWEVLAPKPLEVLERVMAHEAGHVHIGNRDEDPYDGIVAAFDDPFERTVACILAIAIDEYRCEAAAYDAGYLVENSHTDAEIEGTLVGLNIESIAANFRYQEHLDPEELQHDVLVTMSNHFKTLGCLAARHLHADPFDPTNLSEHGEANWTELVAPTWAELLKLLGGVPDASNIWSNSAATQTVVDGVPAMHTFCRSLGYLSEPGAFWIKMDGATFNRRLDRANSETGYFDQQ